MRRSRDERVQVEAMTARLGHRGPDDSGVLALDEVVLGAFGENAETLATTATAAGIA
jgi:asparagine synthetase B (glutamine-hydrolysing)